MAQFQDGKDAGALRTIGEVSAASSIRTHVLRYWEEQFDQLAPLKRAGGRRLYRAEDVTLIERIDRLVNHEGYTLKGAREVLRAATDVRSVPQAAPPADAGAPGDLLPRLRAIRAELAAALAA